MRAYICVLFVVVYTVAGKVSPLKVISVTHIIKCITNAMKLWLSHVASVKDGCVYSCLLLHIPQKRTGNAPSQTLKSVTCNQRLKFDFYLLARSINYFQAKEYCFTI